MKRKLYSFLFLVVALLVFIGVAANLFIFHPVRELWPVNMPFESVSFKSENGDAVDALYLASKENKDTILFFHGNTGNVTYFEDFFEVYAKHGFGIFIFDYPSFGKSEGKLTESNVYKSSQAAVRYLLDQQKIPAEKIILWGYSFGNAPAIQMALDFPSTPFKALILQSPFTNTPEMGAMFLSFGKYNPDSLMQRAVIGTLYFALFNKKYDNAAKIGRVKLPLIIGYNKQDTLIPWQMSDALFKLAPEGSKNFLSPTGKHTGFTWFEGAVLDFLNSLNNSSNGTSGQADFSADGQGK